MDPFIVLVPHGEHIEEGVKINAHSIFLWQLEYEIEVY